MAEKETLQSIWEALRDAVEPSIIDTTHSEMFLWRKLQKKQTSGRTLEFRYRVMRNREATANKERAIIGPAGTRGFKMGYVKPKYNHYPLDFSGPELDTCNGKGSLLASVLGDGITDRVKTAQDDLERQSWLDGSGIIAFVTGTPTNIAGKTTFNIDGGNIFHFLVGMSLDFRAPTVGTARGTGTIIKVTPGANSTGEVVVKVDGGATLTVADNDEIFLKNNYTTTHDIELTGLKAHLGVGNPLVGSYQGRDRTDDEYDFLRANVLAINGVINFEKLTLGYQQGVVRCGAHTNTWFCNLGVHNAFMSLLRNKNIPTNSVPTKFGTGMDTKFVLYGKEFTLVPTNLCQPNTIYMLDMNYMSLRENKSLGFDERIQGKLMPDKDYDTYWTRMKHYGEIVCTLPQAQTIMTGITENAI